MMRLALVFGLLGVVIAGCARELPPSTAAPSEGDSRQRVASAQADLQRLEAELAAPSAGVQVAPVDCSRVCTLVTNICTLSRRICAIAEQDPPAQLGPQCQDATARCQRAERTGASCTCAPAPAP